jgi:hypothetical protein
LGVIDKNVSLSVFYAMKWNKKCIENLFLALNFLVLDAILFSNHSD